MARKFQELRDKMSPERRARVDARVQTAMKEMPLRQLRKARRYTQETLAETMEISQGDVSKIEQRTDHYVSTLRKYLSAMGGELQIMASFPDGTVVKVDQLRDIGSDEDEGRIEERRAVPTRRRTERAAVARERHG